MDNMISVSWQLKINPLTRTQLRACKGSARGLNVYVGLNNVMDSSEGILLLTVMVHSCYKDHMT